MSRKVIVAESGCDMPKNLVNEYDIKIVPMHVAMDEKNLNDGEFPVTEVFSYYNSTKNFPQPAPPVPMNTRPCLKASMKMTPMPRLYISVIRRLQRLPIRIPS